MILSQVFASRSQAWVGAVGLVIWTLPLLAGFTIWHRGRKGQQRRFSTGPLTALLWLFWSLAYAIRLLPEGALGPAGLYVSLMLFGFTLWDWLLSLYGARLQLADYAVGLLIAILAGLLLWSWLLSPAPFRPALPPAG